MWMDDDGDSLITPRDDGISRISATQWEARVQAANKKKAFEILPGIYNAIDNAVSLPIVAAFNIAQLNAQVRDLIAADLRGQGWNINYLDDQRDGQSIEISKLTPGS